MKTILCFGDSNTWGYSPDNGQRIDHNQCWPGVVAQQLGKGVRLIENGLPGRSSYLNNPNFGLTSGINALIDEVIKHQPHWLVLMLGTNDLFPAFKLSAAQVADNINKMIVELREACCSEQTAVPHILLIAPPPLNQGSFAEFFAGAQDKSHQLAELFQKVALLNNAEFLDAATVVNGTLTDGVHLNCAQHQDLGKALADKLKHLV
ncbi:GDSL-type esterase/lipase family protein [Agarivorans litoreus]|uniref:GDSL-type esterase/lipase family protein n=1 Tax=Agarivorans litoreus TaxID=1510455 RepID=UPI001C7D4168|nr:GDSL-type esterase/lipase family protein [Agarivorans litoreus]